MLRTVAAHDTNSTRAAGKEWLLAHSYDALVDELQEIVDVEAGLGETVL